MRTWTEGLLALVVVVGLGLVLFLYSGQPLSAGGGDGNSSPPPSEVDPEAAVRGQLVADSAGCIACHTIDGAAATGPTWKGLAGSDRPLTTGEFVTADDSYLFNSIVDPSSQVVQGFEDVMPPDYRDKLTEDEINDLIAFINSLAA